MTQIAGEVLLQTVKLSWRRRALQNSAGGGNQTPTIAASALRTAN